jgi:hypothetical protein
MGMTGLRIVAVCFRQEFVSRRVDIVVLVPRARRARVVNEVAELIEDWRSIGLRLLVLPASLVEPRRGVLGVPWILPGPLAGVALGALDQRLGLGAVLDRLGERLLGVQFADTLGINRPEPGEGVLDVSPGPRLIFFFLTSRASSFGVSARSSSGSDIYSSPVLFFRSLFHLGDWPDASFVTGWTRLCDWLDASSC